MNKPRYFICKHLRNSDQDFTAVCRDMEDVNNLMENTSDYIVTEVSEEEFKKLTS